MNDTEPKLLELLSILVYLHRLYGGSSLGWNQQARTIEKLIEETLKRLETQ